MLMKNTVKLFTIGMMSMALSAHAAPETYKFDPSHSYILFKITHFDFSSQAGKWYINGEMTLDKDKPENSKVSASVNINDIVTGIPDLDKHLKGKLFFNTKAFPKANFVSDKVEVINDKSAKVYGKLTLHGVTKPVILDVVLNKAGMSPITDLNTVGFGATTRLKRSDFGMTSYLPGVGDDVDITIQVEANQPKSSETANGNQ